jgi:hypothetical protein
LCVSLTRLACAESKEEEERPPRENLRLWAFKHNRQELPYLLLATVAALLEACVWPAYSVLLGGSIAVLQNRDHEEMKITYWAIGYLCEFRTQRRGDRGDKKAHTDK